MENTNQTMYGDENSGYNVLARDMTPEEARLYIKHNTNDGILKQMPPERLSALKARSLEVTTNTT